MAFSDHDYTLQGLNRMMQDDLRKGADALVTAGREGRIPKKMYFNIVSLRSMLSVADSEKKIDDVRMRLVALLPEIVSSIEETTESSYVVEEDSEIASQKKEYFLSQGSSNKVMLRAEMLRKSYGDGEFELTDINATLRLGEITGLVGRNGNGKTTFLRILAGDMQPDGGSLHYFFSDDEAETTDWVTIKHRMAYLPQELPRIAGNMKQAIQIAAAVHGIVGVQNEIETEYIVQRLGLSSYLHKTWNELPGGYKLRFSLARIMIRKPKLIIMDEPLATLDVQARNSLLYDLRELAISLTNPISILLSSQHIEEIEAVSHRIYLLAEGREIYYGPTFGLFKDREENTYELETDLSFENLQVKLKGLNYSAISDAGFSYLITTPISTPINEMLRLLSEQQIPVRAVRDISTSCRKYLL